MLQRGMWVERKDTKERGAIQSFGIMSEDGKFKRSSRRAAYKSPNGAVKVWLEGGALLEKMGISAIVAWRLDEITPSWTPLA